MAEDNLLLVLNKWAVQDENFTTDAFAHLLRHLLRYEPGVGCELVRCLCRGKWEPSEDDAETITVKTQVTVACGRPDMEIKASEHLVYVEVKLGALLGVGQLKCYREQLDGSSVPNTVRLNVSTTFDILIEQLDQEIYHTKQSATASLAADNLDAATATISVVAQLRAFRDVSIEPSRTGSSVQRRNLGRLPRGAKTPESAYYRPILQALAEVGGSGQVGDVLDRVGALLRATLKPVDFQSRNSNPDEERWRNDAQWARLKMVKQGLLKRSSPRGIWEITDAGRHYLTQP